MNTNMPLLSVFNNEIDNTITRWCTPSIHPSVPRVRGIYENDISISYHSLGNPSMNTGIFRKAHELAAKAYKADHTLFTVNGSTGSNFIVLRSLRDQFRSKGKKIHMLAQRNIHKSVSVAVEDFGIDIVYLDPQYNNDLQIFIPNSTKQILSALKTNSEINVLFITNPTYEGLSHDLNSLIKKVKSRYPEIIIFIDEAWGAHLPFSSLLPTCAMEAGADICVQSTHKLGSGLQQTSMIHWNNGLIDEKTLMDSYKSLMTTSPSFHLLASLDGTRDFMENNGEFEIERLVLLSEKFRAGLATVKGLHTLTLSELSLLGDTKFQVDPTKILVHLSKHSGSKLAKYLEEEHRIIVEKYEAKNILFIVTFQNTVQDIERTINAIKKGLKELGTCADKVPDFPLVIRKKISSHSAAESRWKRTRLSDAIGKISAEDIVPYPPGIPIVTKGEEITREHITYLEELRGGLITVVISDETLGTIKTVIE